MLPFLFVLKFRILRILACLSSKLDIRTLCLMGSGFSLDCESFIGRSFHYMAIVWKCLELLITSRS